MVNLESNHLRILLEINALQSLGAVQTFSQSSSSSNSLFQSMLGEILSGGSPATASGLAQAASPEGLQYNGLQTPYVPAAALEQRLQPSPIDSAVTMGATQTKASYKGKYKDIIQQAAAKYNLPENLISAVIKQESNFNNSVVSHAGAAGLMQLMPGTAKYIGVTDRFDPVQNIMGGSKYLRKMLDQFGTMEKALAAYNAGPGNVKKYGGIPPFKETQQYVKKVMNYYNGIV